MSGPQEPREPGAGGAPDLDSDVERIHRPLYREPRDPEEGREPPPWWIWAATVLAIFWGGFYLGRFGGTFGTGTHEAFAAREPAVTREVEETEARRREDPVAHGQRIYENVCQSCHQPDGRGIPGAFPPLRGSRWVTGPEERLLRVLLDGLQGPIEVAGARYDGVMPAWRGQLSDADLAAVATFVRQWEPNEAPAVARETAARLREATAGRGRPWTAAALESREAASGEPAGEGP